MLLQGPKIHLFPGTEGLLVFKVWVVEELCVLLLDLVMQGFRVPVLLRKPLVMHWHRFASFLFLVLRRSLQLVVLGKLCIRKLFPCVCISIVDIYEVFAFVGDSSFGVMLLEVGIKGTFRSSISILYSLTY